MYTLLRSATVLAFFLAASAAAAADVKVENAWARAPAPGQKVASAYAELTSPSNAALLGAASPVAERVELHTMTMDGGVMRMRAVPRVELPAGTTVKLAPGGLHLMLFGLKQPLHGGDKVPLELSVQSAGSAPATLKVEAEVRSPGASDRK
jgi:copper(I)-binding protein